MHIPLSSWPITNLEPSSKVPPISIREVPISSDSVNGLSDSVMLDPP